MRICYQNNNIKYWRNNYMWTLLKKLANISMNPKLVRYIIYPIFKLTEMNTKQRYELLLMPFARLEVVHHPVINHNEWDMSRYFQIFVFERFRWLIYWQNKWFRKQCCLLCWLCVIYLIIIPFFGVWYLYLTCT